MKIPSRSGTAAVSDGEEQRVYTALYQQVERFRKKRGSMAMRDLEAAESALPPARPDQVKKKRKH